MVKVSVIAGLALLFSAAQAFVVPKTNSLSTLQRTIPTASSVNTLSTSTTLFERQWNFNDGRGPWGLKKNAEIWNGRVAQMGFTVVLLQELITGKGVVQGFKDGDAFSYIMVGITAVSILGLTVLLAIKGKDSDIVIDE
mmetsp:Transcript_10661/g.13494  ORF Transcript_10661/g.13494 Transcript_10661/m.13494 type:complete len:139 (+) Transcript_10661:183-599(+)